VSRVGDVIARGSVLAACLALAALRVGGERGEFFQGVAHIWVGGLFGFAWGRRSRFAFVAGLALTAVEVAAFLVTRG